MLIERAPFIHLKELIFQLNSPPGAMRTMANYQDEIAPLEGADLFALKRQKNSMGRNSGTQFDQDEPPGRLKVTKKSAFRFLPRFRFGTEYF